jgi:hypothetical protein
MDRYDLDCAPFDGKDGIGKMCQLFGDEINEALAA